MVTLENVDLLALQSKYMQQDPTTRALCAALNPLWQDLAEAAGRVILYPRISELSGPVLDEIAWAWHVDGYSALASDEEKRRMILNSIQVHKYKGTVYAVEKIVEGVFGEDGSVDEWFNYGGDPYHFRADVLCSDRGVTADDQARAIQLINAGKNLRSTLDGIQLILSSGISQKIATAATCSAEITVYPKNHVNTVQFSGSVIEIRRTFDQFLKYLQIAGQTVQDGTGDPSPGNVRTIHGTTSLTDSDGGSNSRTINLPQTLYSLPDGTADSYDVVSGDGTQKIGKVVLDGSGTWVEYGALVDDTYYAAYRQIVGMKQNVSVNIVSDRFVSAPYLSLKENIYGGTGSQYGIILIRIQKSRLLSSDISGMKTWLSSNPVTVLFALDTPVAIGGEGQQIATYKPYMKITNNAGAQMATEATVLN